MVLKVNGSPTGKQTRILKIAMVFARLQRLYSWQSRLECGPADGNTTTANATGVTRKHRQDQPRCRRARGSCDRRTIPFESRPTRGSHFDRMEWRPSRGWHVDRMDGMRSRSNGWHAIAFVPSNAIAANRHEKIKGALSPWERSPRSTVHRIELLPSPRSHRFHAITFSFRWQ